MARKRMIDPNFWRDEKLAQCTYMERLLFQGLWTFAEDNGVGRASPMLIKADIFPYDTLRASDIESSLAKLASLGLILLYEIDEQKYYLVINFLKHQVINKPSKCYLPEPLPEHYDTTTTPLRPNIKEVNIREEKISKRTLDDFFEMIWKSYPRKEGKGQVSYKQKETLYKIGLDEMSRAVERYKISKQGVENKYLKQGSTFFNSGYIDYLDSNYEEPQIEQKETAYERAKREADEMLRKEGIVLE